jgi:hydrogenase nickel incorporation protein HypA/HybF
MREFQATQSILTKALLQMRQSNAKRIKTIRLAIGEIAELDHTAIQRHWDEISKGTTAEQASLQFRLIKAKVQCMACFREYHPTEGEIHCPHCGSYGAKVLSGEEFYLESIELDDEQDKDLLDGDHSDPSVRL